MRLLFATVLFTSTLTTPSTRAQELRSFEVTDLLAGNRSERAATAFVRRFRLGDLDREPTYAFHYLPNEWSFLPEDGVAADDRPLVVGRPPLDVSQLEMLVDALTDGRALLEFEKIGGRSFALAEEPDLVRGALDTIRAVPTGRYPTTIRLSSESATSGARPRILLASSAQIDDGRVRSFGLRRQVSRLSQMEPEVAMGSSIGNPVSERFDEGATVALRARRLPFTDRFLVECLVRSAEIEDALPMPIHESLGPLERVGRGFAEVGTTFVTKEGEERTIVWTDRFMRRNELSITIGSTPSAQGTAPSPIAWTNFTNTGIASFRYETDPYLGGSEIDLAQYLERAAIQADESVAVFDAASAGDPGILALRGDDRGLAAAQRIGRRLESLFPALRLEAQVLQIDGEVPEAFVELSSAQRPIARFDTQALPEIPSSFGVGTDRNLVIDHETEIAQGARMLLPRIELIESGSFMTLTPRIGADGRVASITVALDASVVVHRSIETTMSMRMLGNLQAAASVTLESDTVPVEMPEVTTFSFRETVSLDQSGFGSTVLTVQDLDDPASNKRWVLQVRLAGR